MKLKVNGAEEEVDGNMSVADFVSLKSLGPERVAVELNGAIVKRAAWPSTRLSDGDKVEIVHFVGGGNG